MLSNCLWSVLLGCYCSVTTDEVFKESVCDKSKKKVLKAGLFILSL